MVIENVGWLHHMLLPKQPGLYEPVRSWRRQFLVLRSGAVNVCWNLQGRRYCGATGTARSEEPAVHSRRGVRRRCGGDVIGGLAPSFSARRVA